MTERAALLRLRDFAQRISSHLACDDLQEQWIEAELSDVTLRGGHCYMELVEKDSNNGSPIARMRAIIWASVYQRLMPRFMAETGCSLESGMKVCVKASVSFHPSYGLTVVVSDINPEVTSGDLIRRRIEIIETLKREGALNLNRELDWNEPAYRIAIISSPRAAGYGDFIHQLMSSDRHLRFSPKLFQATMQGSQTVESIMSSLESIGETADEWDCVVIIRGGGATTDFACFESLELARAIATFPIPVIIGIGHERDITVLDYVANTRVKTPTAAAELLISRMTEALEKIVSSGRNLLQIVTSRLSGNMEQLARIETMLPQSATMAVNKQLQSIGNLMLCVANAGNRKIIPELSRLEILAKSITDGCSNTIMRKKDRLFNMCTLTRNLSPKSTLRRGYSITRVDGKVARDAKQIAKDNIIETELANGLIRSKTL